MKKFSFKRTNKKKKDCKKGIKRRLRTEEIRRNRKGKEEMLNVGKKRNGQRCTSYLGHFLFYNSYYKFTNQHTYTCTRMQGTQKTKKNTI